MGYIHATFGQHFCPSLYCGFWRKVCGWFRQPPALWADEFHAPVTCFSVQVLEKEKRDVLISRQIANSENWCRKSSKGILRWCEIMCT